MASRKDECFILYIRKIIAFDLCDLAAIVYGSHCSEVEYEMSRFTLIPANTPPRPFCDFRSLFIKD